MKNRMLRDLIEEMDGPEVTLEDCKRMLLQIASEAEPADCDGQMKPALGNLRARCVQGIAGILQWEAVNDSGEALEDLLAEEEENVIPIKKRG